MTLDRQSTAERSASATSPQHVESLATSQLSLGPINPATTMQAETSRISDGAASLPHRPSLSSLHPSAAPSRLASQSSLDRPVAAAAAAAAAGTSNLRTHIPEVISTESPAAPGDVLLPVILTPQGALHQQRSATFSLQSSVNALTPPLSTAATPRAAAAYGFMGIGKHSLPLFQSVLSTPDAEAGLADGPRRSPSHFVQRTDKATKATDVVVTIVQPSAQERGAAVGAAEGPVELPMGTDKKPNYGTDDKSGVGTEAVNDMDGSEHSNDNSSDERERSTLEFNSFAAMDTSFMSNASSPRGGAGPPHGGYNTLSKAAFHIFKGNVGAGVFLLPTYYQDSGYILGVLLVTVLGLLMIDCALGLLHAKHAINRAEINTYPAVVGYVLGSWPRHFTDFALVFTQFSFCIIYIQYASSTFASLFSFPHAYAVWIAVTVVAVTPMTFLSNKMNLLAYASVLAGLFVAAVLVGTTAVDVQYLSTNGVAAGVLAFVPTARILVFLSGHMFSLEGIGVVLPVENSLAPDQRGKFDYVVKYTLLCIVAMYILFGVLGYAAYGETLHTSVVLALPKGFMKRLLQCLLGLSLIFGFPIQFVPAIQLVDRAMGVNVRRDRTKAYTVRTVLNVLFGLFALFIGGDALNIFASFVGAFAGVHLMITIPALLALQIDNALDPNRDALTYRQYMAKLFKGELTWKRIRCYVYLVLALIVWVGGLYFTVVSVLGSSDSGEAKPTTMTTTTTTTTAAPLNRTDG